MTTPPRGLAPRARVSMDNSRNRHNAFANCICLGDRQSGAKSRGLATRTTAHRALDVATLSRFRLYRNSIPRGASAGERRGHRVDHDRRLLALETVHRPDTRARQAIANREDVCVVGSHDQDVVQANGRSDPVGVHPPQRRAAGTRAPRRHPLPRASEFWLPSWSTGSSHKPAPSRSPAPSMR